MEGLLKYNYAEADATGVAHDSIDAELAKNRQDKLEKIIHQSREEGSIRALPYLQTAEGQQTMLDIAMGAAFPGAAVGRMSKAAVTGGQRILSNKIWKQPEMGRMRTDEEAANILAKYFKDLMKPKPKFKPMKAPGPKHEMFKKPPGLTKELTDKIKWDNKTNAARLSWEKAMKKWGVKPDERQLMDPVSEILRTSKYKQN